MATGRCFGRGASSPPIALVVPSGQSTCSETPCSSRPVESVRQKLSSEGSWRRISGQKQKCARLSGGVALGGCTKTVSTLMGSCSGMATTEGSAPGWRANCTTGPYIRMKVNSEEACAARAAATSAFLLAIAHVPAPKWAGRRAPRWSSRGLYAADATQGRLLTQSVR